MNVRQQRRRLRGPARRVGNAGYYVAGRLWRNMTIGTKTDEKVIALTFDDGPDPHDTPQFLAILEKYQVPATFFLLGRMVDAHPESARQVAEQGHALGNHGYSHCRFPDLSRAELVGEIFTCEEAIHRATGQRPRILRPPFGTQTPAKQILLSSLGYRAIYWSATGDDWRGDPAEEIASKVVSQADPGGIVLLHDGWEPKAHDTLPNPDHDRFRDRTPTIQALPVIIEELTSRGYQFVTVPDLLQRGRPRRRAWFVPA